MFAARKGFDCRRSRLEDGIRLPFFVEKEGNGETEAQRQAEGRGKVRHRGPALGKEVSAEHEEERRAAEKGGPAEIDAPPRRGVRPLQHHCGSDDQDHAYRQVYEEDVPPAEAAHYPSSEVRPDNAADGEDAGEEADGPLPAFREIVAHYAGGGRQQARAADALQEPEGDQGVNVRRQAARQRAPCEERQAEQVDVFPPEGVAHVPDEGHRHHHRDEIEGDRPRRPKDIRMEVLDERRQGDRDDRGIDGHHQKTQRDHCENEVALHTESLRDWRSEFKPGEGVGAGWTGIFSRQMRATRRRGVLSYN